MTGALVFCLALLLQSDITMEAVYEYVLTEDEKASYDSMLTQQARIKFIEGVWKRLDPTPETATYNELQEEFLYRLSLADMYFSLNYMVGWRTDRGRVLIHYGIPNEVRRSRFAPPGGPKYEIWIYRDREIERDAVEVVFEDENDTGEFGLITPVLFPDRFSPDAVLPKLAPEAPTPR